VKAIDHNSTTDGSIASIPHDLMGQIIATASDIALILSADGVIRSVLVNPHHRSFGTLNKWEGQPLRQVLTVESIGKFDARLRELIQQGGTRAVELNHLDDHSFEFPVRYALHRVAADGTILMLGRDLRPVAEMQQQLVKAQLALERDYEAQREIDTRYRVLMETTRDAIVVVSMTTGRIVDLNLAAAVVLGGSRQDMIGAAIAQEFEGRRRGEFLESMANLAITDSSSPLELQARRSHKRLLVVPTVFRAAGERLLMCRLELADVGDAQRDELTENLFGLFHEGADGVVFTDIDGMIRSANEAFLNLTDSASLAAVKGRSLGDFLARGAVDLRVLSDNARRVGQMRMYATKVNAAYGGQISVEIAATYLNDRPQPFFVFVVRGTSRAEALRRPGLNVSEDGGRSIMELVGSSTLKDIVAETTDVVEKMCIETAVELTRNNRVAAAEMLGLSRQSLYVKLRKYGLVGNEGDQP
jgi:transcriptional regulator PpsR